MASGMDAIIARGLPAIDPVGDLYKIQSQQQEQALRRQAMQQAAAMQPYKIAEAQQNAQINAAKLQEYQADQADAQTIQTISADPALGGDPDKIATALVGKLQRPKNYWDFRTNAIKTHADKIAGDKSAAELADAHGKHTSNLAYGALFNGSPAAFGGYLDHAVADGSMTKAESDAIANEHTQAPDPDAWARTHLLGKLTPADRKIYDENLAAGPKLEKEQSDMQNEGASRRWSTVKDQPTLDALKKLFPKADLPDTFDASTPQQVRMLTVPAKDQPKMELEQGEADWLRDPQRLPKLKAQIDSVIPPSKGPIYAYENNMATQAVANARNPKDAQAAIKDSADRIGRFEVSQNLATATRDARPEPTGTLTVAEDAEGKPVLLNTRTGEVKTSPGVQRTGTAAKAAEATAPIEQAYTYAHSYLKNGNFTGPGDEALLMKFFELEKTSKGFRMTQPQIDMLINARGWMGTAAARFRHATKGTWLDDDQRRQIVGTIDDLYKSKQAGTAAPATGGKKDLSTASTDELLQMLK